MYSLTVKGALAYVRKAIDELVSVEEIGMLVSPDAINLHRLVEGSMVEAALRTYAQAPTESLEGVKAEVESDYTLVGIEDGVVTIAFETPIARVLSLRCVDSEIIVNDLIPENSAEGRKQLNKYVQGTYDDPRVVLQKVWNGDNMPILKYYTTKQTEPQQPIMIIRRKKRSHPDG